jgi:amino acid adenylation domain-containing protein
LTDAFLFHREFGEQVRRTPAATALFEGDESVSFAELDALSARVANHLIVHGTGAGSFIGLHATRSIPYVAAMLGILRANAAVVPLPPSYPAHRLDEILAFARLDAVLDTVATPLLSTHRPHTIRLDEALTCSSPHAPIAEGVPDQPAFVLASSGSTGTPRLIVRSHRSFLHRLAWTWEQHPFTNDELCVQKSFMTTTHSVYELFEPLLRGIPVHIVPDERLRDLAAFWEFVAARNVSRLLIVPSLLQTSLDIPEFLLPSLKVLILMGEHVPRSLAARLLTACQPHTRIISIYGSSEASSTLVCDVRALFVADDELPLGIPIAADVEVAVLDDDHRPVAPGAEGMLYIGGSPLFSGYFRSPEATAATLLQDAGHGLYRTSDRVLVRGDGSLAFAGRSDDAVKLRGFRVALGDVERVLASHPDVRLAAAALANPGEPGAALMAFVAPATVEPSRVFDLVRRELPFYMVPSAIIALDEFPRTASGKIDRRRLVAGNAQSARAAPLVGATASEERVAGIWSGVLQHSTFGRDTSFFEAGGTSLNVFAVTHRLRAEFGLARGQLSDNSIYEHPTIAALALHLERVASRGPSVQDSGAGTPLVTLRTGSEAVEPLFVVSSAGGTLGAYEKLVQAMHTGRELIGIRDPFLWGGRDPTLDFQRWTGTYVDAIRRRQQHGPYHILAYSSAGAFGIEIAQQLRAAGETVSLLALVDPLAIDRGSERRFGHWAMRAAFMRGPFRQLILLGGRLRAAVPTFMRARQGAAPVNDHSFSAAAVAEISRWSRTDRDHILRYSALLELNSSLPLALFPDDLASHEPDEYMGLLRSRAAQVAPDVDPGMFERISAQYELQVRSHHNYRLRRYDGPVVLFGPRQPYHALIRALLRPYMRNMRTRVLPHGTLSGRREQLALNFSARIRWHYFSMRDDTFARALAQELDALLR